MTTTPFPRIEKAVRDLLIQLDPTIDGKAGGDLSYATGQEFYVWLGLVRGQATELDGTWTLDIDVFDNFYSQAMDLSLKIEALLLKRGGHRTPTMLFDTVSQNESPVERFWEDDNVFRVGATYTFTGRRRATTDPLPVIPVIPDPVAPDAGTVDPDGISGIDPVLMFENALI